MDFNDNDAIEVAIWRTTPSEGKVLLLRPLTQGFIEMQPEDGAEVVDEIRKLILRVQMGDKPNPLEKLALRLIFEGYTPRDALL